MPTEDADTADLHRSRSIVLPTPAPGLDNRVTLAMGLQAAPGAYAVLLGSGMSRAANVPTGWEVVQDLLLRVAAAEGVDLSELDCSPEVWWEDQGRGEPGYDELVAALASTEGARQRLLSRYFEPPPHPSGSVEPTIAHHELAQLVASGRVRVVLTTNLDRLTERALDYVGLVPQVIAAPEQVKTMMPLTHARATVVKLHGDYATLGSRNTPDELATYPPEWQALLARVFEDYGLVVVGWSAQYDEALGAALASAPRHAFPVFWATYNGELTEQATRLIGLRRAGRIDTAGADEFLADINQRIQRLDQMAARRGRPRRILLFNHDLQESEPAPQGWSVSPLLHVRVVARVGPVQVGESTGIGPEQRGELCKRLTHAAATHRLRSLAGLPAASAITGQLERSPAGLGNWHPAPVQHQSSGHAVYRFGGEGNSGVSALVSVQLPIRSNSVALTVDAGLSIDRRFHLFEVALLLRDYLVLTTGPMFDSIADIMPVGAEPLQAEVYIAAPTRVGDGFETRENSLSERIELSPLGNPPPSLRNTLAYAVELQGSLVERDAAELVLEAVRAMALDAGFLDPRRGLVELRAQIGLPASS